METAQPSDKGIPSRVSVSGAGVHLPLRPLHGLERKLCLGRPLRINSGRAGGLNFRTDTDQVRGRTCRNRVEYCSSAYRSEPSNSDCLADVLAPARNLPSRRPRPSAMDRLAPPEEHCGVRTRQNGRLGPDHRFHEVRPVGLSAHYYMEFSAICAAEDGSSADAGSESCVCGLDYRCCGSWILRFRLW